MKEVLRVLEKLFAIVVIVPPLYMAYRFVKWYWKQQAQYEDVES